MVEKVEDILKQFEVSKPQAVGGVVPPTGLVEKLKQRIRETKEASTLTDEKIEIFTKAIVDSYSAPKTFKCTNVGKEKNHEVIWDFKDGKCEIISTAFEKSIWIVQERQQSLPIMGLREYVLNDFIALLKIAYKFDGKVAFP